MRCASDNVDPDRRPLRHLATALQRGIFATILLVATVTAAQAGGLFEKLFTGKEAQRADTPQPQGSAPLATVRLSVEGMVCYG